MHNMLEIYFAIRNKTEKLLIEENGYQQNKKAIGISEWLYRQNRIAIDKTEKLSIEQKGYLQNRKAIDRTKKLSKNK